MMSIWSSLVISCSKTSGSQLIYFLYFRSPIERVICRLPWTKLLVLWTIITPPWLSTLTLSSSFEARCSRVMSNNSFFRINTAFESPALAKYNFLPRMRAQSAVLPPCRSPDSRTFLSICSKANCRDRDIILSNSHQCLPSFKAVLGSSAKHGCDITILWKFCWRYSLTFVELWPS